MVPYFQMVQAAERSLLIRGSFTPDELRLLLDSLDPRGLYLLILVADIEEVAALKPILGMFGFGLAFAIQEEMIPAMALPWIYLVVTALAGGLTATGYYDLLKRTGVLQ